MTIAVAAGLVTPALVTPALAIDDGPPATSDRRDTPVQKSPVQEAVPDRTPSVAEESDGSAATSPPDAEDSPVPPSDPGAAWGIALAPVPDLLRAHLPGLRFGEGLVVTAVDASGPAAKFGIRRFDVLLEANGIPLVGTERLGEPDGVFWVTVLRRGRVTPLALRRGPGGHAPRARHGAGWTVPPPPRFSMPQSHPPEFGAPEFGAPEFGAPEFGAPFGFPDAADPFFGEANPFPGEANPFAGEASAIASASSTANGSMSVSRVGDQISVELVSPATEGRRVQLRGTVDEIKTQMEQQQLSPAARQEVWDALGNP